MRTVGLQVWARASGGSRLQVGESAYEDRGACEVCDVAMNGCRSLQVIRRYEEYVPSVWLS